jgi:hypothetical protein
MSREISELPDTGRASVPCLLLLHRLPGVAPDADARLRGGDTWYVPLSVLEDRSSDHKSPDASGSLIVVL